MNPGLVWHSRRSSPRLRQGKCRDRSPRPSHRPHIVMSHLRTIYLFNGFSCLIGQTRKWKGNVQLGCNGHYFIDHLNCHLYKSVYVFSGSVKLGNGKFLESRNIRFRLTFIWDDCRRDIYKWLYFVTRVRQSKVSCGFVNSYTVLWLPLSSQFFCYFLQFLTTCERGGGFFVK